jgi:hypothetical protein
MVLEVKKTVNEAADAHQHSQGRQVVREHAHGRQEVRERGWGRQEDHEHSQEH